MAKSSLSTKNLKEALTPDQVSKVEDKYKSIYSGMLKGDKKKLMKYIDPKLKRPNPDAMAMGRAINLVKKETETVNESFSQEDWDIKWKMPKDNLFNATKTTDAVNNRYKALQSLLKSKPEELRVFDADENHPAYDMSYDELMKWYNELTETVTEATDSKVLSAIETLKKVKFGSKRKEAISIVLAAAKAKTGEHARTYKQALQMLDLEEPINESSPELDKIRKEVELIAKNSLGKGWTKKSIDQEINRRLQQFLNRETVNEQMDAYDEIAQSEFGMDYEQLGSGEQEWVRDEIDNMELREESVNEYINPGYQIETKYFDPNEVKAVADQLQGITDIENIQYKEFKWADGTGGLSFTISSDYRDTGLDYLVRLEHTHDGKWKSKVFATYGAGASEVDFGEVDLNIDMEGFTNMKDITKETFRGVWDKMLRAAAPALKSKRREMEAHQSKSNQSQRDFYKDRGQTSGTIDERLATLVKEVYSEKQRKWACSQDGPEFDEMCKDTAISKKKLNEGIDFEKVASYFGMSYSEFYSKSLKSRKEMVERYKKDNTSLNEETDELKKLELDLYNMIQSKTKDSQIVSMYAKYKRKGGKKELGNIAQGLNEERTSTVSKARAKSELKQMLKGKRDDGMGKSTLKAVLAIDKDGKETKISKLEDFEKFEKGTKFSLKETIMNNDRLTELIKAALAGPVKEDNFHSPRTVKNTPIGDEDKELTTVDLDWYEKKEEERSRKAGADMRKNMNSLKEGVWSMGTVTEINRFIKDIEEMKNHYYDIVGSDDVFDGLDRAQIAAEELAMNAPENRSDLAEKQQRPDYPDIDGDGDTKEPMAKAAKDKEKGMNEELATTPIKDDIYAIGSRIYKDPYEAISLVATDQSVVVRDFSRKDKKFKAAVMDYVKSKGLETSVDRDGLYIDTKPLDFKGIPLMNEKSLAESIFKKLRG